MTEIFRQENKTCFFHQFLYTKRQLKSNFKKVLDKRYSNSCKEYVLSVKNCYVTVCESCVKLCLFSIRNVWLRFEEKKVIMLNVEKFVSNSVVIKFFEIVLQ